MCGNYVTGYFNRKLANTYIGEKGNTKCDIVWVNTWLGHGRQTD